MPYYSMRVIGGDYDDAKELRDMFNGQDADYTGTISFFYVERNYDIEQLRRNAAGGGKRGVTVEINEISKREFEWRKHQ